MQEIVDSVRQVSELIAEIAAASQEQSQGIGQVNTAVSQMERVVQQNASLVEEASAAAEAMKEQAQALLQMVSRFNLEAQRGAARGRNDAHRAGRHATPAPIQMRKGAALPPAYAALQATWDEE